MVKERRNTRTQSGENVEGTRFRRVLAKAMAIMLLVVFVGGLGVQWHNLEKIEDMVKADCTPPAWPSPLPKKPEVIFKNTYSSLPMPSPEVSGHWFTEVRYTQMKVLGAQEYQIEFRVVEGKKEIGSSLFTWTNMVDEGMEFEIPMCTWMVAVDTLPDYESRGYGRYVALLGYGEMFLRGHVTSEFYFRSIDINWERENPKKQTFAQIVIPEAFYAYGGQVVSSIPPVIPREVLPPYFEELHWYPTRGPRK